MKSIKNLISLGYLLMALLVIGIMYIWYKEMVRFREIGSSKSSYRYFRQELHKYLFFLLNFLYRARQYWNGNMQIWNITIINEWQWTVCYAVSKRFIRQSA